MPNNQWVPIKNEYPQPSKVNCSVCGLTFGKYIHSWYFNAITGYECYSHNHYYK